MKFLNLSEACQCTPIKKSHSKYVWSSGTSECSSKFWTLALQKSTNALQMALVIVRIKYTQGRILRTFSKMSVCSLRTYALQISVPTRWVRTKLRPRASDICVQKSCGVLTRSPISSLTVPVSSSWAPRTCRGVGPARREGRWKGRERRPVTVQCRFVLVFSDPPTHPVTRVMQSQAACFFYAGHVTVIDGAFFGIEYHE